MAVKLSTYYRSKDIPDLPGNNTFHSKELFVVYENTKGYTPFMIVATEGEQVLGKLLATLRKKVNLLGLPSLVHKCCVYGAGEYFCTKEQTQELLGEMIQHLTQEVSRKCFIVEFRNLGNPLLGYKHFKENGYFAINWLRVRNKLQKGESLEETFSASRVRQIRKALQHGAEVSEAATLEEVRQFAILLRKIYTTHIRKHYPSVEFFQHLKNIPYAQGRKNSAIYVVKYKNKIIGGAACVFSGKDVYLWFSGGMHHTFASVYPGVLAVWGALKDARERGFDHLEFMDVGLPFKRHSYREFVLRFGGTQSSTRRWFRISWKWLNKLFSKMYE